MAKLLKLRRGTTSQHSSFTGAEGEVTVDTTKDTLVVHDGSTQGGIPLAKESASLSLIDEDNMSTDSATRPPSQQSVKAYVDTTVAAHILDEDDMATDSATKPPSQQSAKVYFAPKAAPAFTGTATGVNLTLSGNLTVNGTTTTVATTNTTVTDNLLELNSGAGSNANDSGILIERGSTGDNAIIAWDESEDRFTLGTTTATNDATGNISVSTGTLAANIVGNVTGNASGSSGSCTGNAATADAVDTTSSNNDATHYLTMVSSSGTEAGSTIRKYSNINCNPNSGAVTATTINDGKGNVRSIPQNTQGSTYTLVAADAGKHILASGTITIPNSVFSAGDAVTIVNNTSGDLTLTASVGTLYNTADAATGNRTLATRGMATILFTSATAAYISGAGLS